MDKIKSVLLAAAAAVLFPCLPVFAASDDFGLQTVAAAGIKDPAADIPAPSPEGPSSLKEWTIMAFINGNNNLEHRAIEKLGDMEAAGSTERVNIVAELGKMNGHTSDGQKWSGSRRYYLVDDGREYHLSSPAVQEFGKADMGDWRHLADFVNWAKTNYPAKKYMLIMFGHGSGWVSIDKPLTKGMLYDDESGNHVTSVEMRKVFETAGPVDVIFMDSCLMQDLGALYELRKHAGVIVGSQDSIQANGIMYEYSLKNVTAKPEMGSEEAAEAMVFPGGIGHPVFTLSAVRVSSLEKLAGLLDGLAGRLLAAGLADYRTARDAAYNPDEDYVSQRDLGHFLGNLSSSAADSEVRAGAAEAFRVLKSEVVLKNHALYDEKENGLSVYLPAKKFNRDFRVLSFAENTRWDELVKAGLKK